MSKLAKRASYPFTKDQPALAAIERRTVPQREHIVAFYRTHEGQSWSLSDLIDIKPEDIRVDELQESDLFVAESTMLVESNNPDYVANLLEYFTADQYACDFVMMWAHRGVEALLRVPRLLVRCRSPCTRARPASDQRHDRTCESESKQRSRSRWTRCARPASTNWGIPTHYLPVQLVANTTLQEFVTAEFYRNHAKQTSEPVLARIETLLAKDETRHEMFYEAR